MKTSVTTHLQAAGECIREAIQVASKKESINDIQTLVDLLIAVEELVDNADTEYQFNFDNVVISGGESSDIIDFGGYNYNPFAVAGDYIVGASGTDTISFG